MHSRSPGWDKNNHLSATDAAYLAGIVDGEGCIIIHKINKPTTNWYSLKLIIKSADKIMVPECAKLIGKCKIQHFKRKESKHTDTVQITLSGSRAKNILQQILPYLKVKYEQAYAGIVFQNLQEKCTKSNKNTEIKHEFYLLLQNLKQQIKLPKGLSNASFA